MSKAPSQNAIGRALGLSSANMVKLKKQGCPMDSVESARAWREKKQNVAARKPTPAALAPSAQRVGGDDFRAMIRATEVNADGSALDESHDQARTRREIAEANLAEMKETELRGITIRLDAVKATLAVAFATAREALLQIPSRLAPLLAADSDPASVQNVLHGEIHQALAHLSGASERLGQTVVDVE